MIKKGTIPIEDQARNAYWVWHYILCQSPYSVESFDQQPGMVQLAWATACDQFNRLFNSDALESRKWPYIASLFYERVRQGGGLDKCSLEFDDTPREVRIAAEGVVRHLVNCYQADDGEKLEGLLLALIKDWLPKAEESLTHAHNGALV